ncbi:protein translocase subunit SecF [Patescibacteria group bacterium]|nr:protein translocase subunit SecF [Patescibacteria group bacterium]
MMFIIKYKKIFFLISSILVIGSVLALIFYGLNLGIDFTGGSLMEGTFIERPSNDQIKEKLKDFDLGEIVVQQTGENNILIRMKDINEETHQEILNSLEGFEELRFESIGPVIGQELKKKAIYAIIVTLIVILLFIALAFRKVSFIIKSYKYGILAVLALFHDILIVLGVFAILGKFLNVEVGVPFVAALLATLGYSVNDSIIVFDRVRENLLISEHREDLDELVSKSLKQTLVRSLNTSLTTLLVLLAVLFFGGSTIQYFILALVIGIIAGTYSSLFIAAPLLVVWEKRKK